MTRDAGFATPAVLAILMAMALVWGGVAASVAFDIRAAARTEKTIREREVMDGMVMQQAFALLTHQKSQISPVGSIHPCGAEDVSTEAAGLSSPVTAGRVLQLFTRNASTVQEHILLVTGDTDRPVAILDTRPAPEGACS